MEEGGGSRTECLQSGVQRGCQCGLSHAMRRTARKTPDGYHASLETLCISCSAGAKRSWDFAASFSSTLLHSVVHGRGRMIPAVRTRWRWFGVLLPSIEPRCNEFWPAFFRPRHRLATGQTSHRPDKPRSHYVRYTKDPVKSMENTRHLRYKQ